MLNIFSKLYELKEVVGISYFIDHASQTRISICRLKLNKEIVSILECKMFYDWKLAFTWLKEFKEIPIAFHVEGRVILTKEFTGEIDLNQDSILTVFPNYSENDYIVTLENGSGKSWLNIANKESIDSLLLDFKHKGFNICQLSIGPFVFLNTINQFNGYDGLIIFNGHQFQWDKSSEKLTNYTFREDAQMQFPIRLNGKEIEENHIFSYAAAFSLLMHDYLDDRSVAIDEIKINLQDNKQKKKFQVNGLLLLISFFTLLLINTLVFIHYSSKLKDANFQSEKLESKYYDLQKLTIKAEKNDSLLIALGWNGGVYKSWIMNQLVNSVKHDIILRNISIGVNLEKITVQSEQYPIPINRIKIIGSCRNLNALESWTRKLRSYPWLKNVEISRFHDQQINNLNLKEFELNLSYES